MLVLHTIHIHITAVNQKKGWLEPQNHKPKFVPMVFVTYLKVIGEA